jgi:hypothetical protein
VVRLYPSSRGSRSSRSVRWNHSFASYFTTFNDFLAFGWGAIVVTDRRTGKGHVAVRSANPEHLGGSVGQGGTVQQFARMIKVRFGESLPKLPNQVSTLPFEKKRIPVVSGY